MKPRTYNLLVLLAFAGCLSTGDRAMAQGIDNLWLPLGIEDYASPGNWSAGGIPQANPFEERAVINNGGTAFLSVDTGIRPGGIDVTNGTLDIRRSGTLETEIGAQATGTLTVGAGGQLIVGELTGTAASNLTVVAGATIQGTLSVIGPNANFSAANINLPGTLHTTVTVGGSSAIKTAGTATLSGPLVVDIIGTSPSVGSTYDILDAATISGGFSQVTTNAVLPPGVFLEYGTVADGMHGNLGQISAEYKLELLANRRTGELQIANRSTSETHTIDGYLITSPAGTLDSGQWNSFHDNGFPIFREAVPSGTHVGELTLAGSRSIAAETSVGLGSIYSDPTAPLSPTVDGDLTFEYHLDGGSNKVGVVDYVGPHNNLVLVVNPDGQTYLQNQSTVAIELDGYFITSLSNSLDENNWTSFASGDSLWRESNPASNHLGELNLGGSLLLEAESAAIDLGHAFVVGGQRDLTFTYNVSGVGTLLGTVEYEDGVIEFDSTNPGDHNGDGVVNAADYVFWRDTMGDQAGYDAWKANFGAIGGSGTSVAAVPEPSAWGLLTTAVAAIFAAVRRQRRF